MPFDSQSRPQRSQRDVEYEYLGFAYQLTHLVEERHRSVSALARLTELYDQAQSCLKNNPTSEEREIVEQILAMAEKEAKSYFRLGYSVSNYRKEVRRLTLELKILGARLGY